MSLTICMVSAPTMTPIPAARFWATLAKLVPDPFDPCQYPHKPGQKTHQLKRIQAISHQKNSRHYSMWCLRPGYSNHSQRQSIQQRCGSPVPWIKQEATQTDRDLGFSQNCSSRENQLAKVPNADGFDMTVIFNFFLAQMVQPWLGFFLWLICKSGFVFVPLLQS